MIAVVGGAGILLKVKMIPQENTYDKPMMGDTFDYETLNVEAKVAQGDDVEVDNSGSAFNIACNLAKMGKDVAFATVVAEDAMGLAVTEQLKRYGIETKYVKTVEGSTPVEMQILNVLNDPQMVFGNSKLYETMTPEMAEEWSELFDTAEAIVIDGNLPKETLEYIANKYGDKKLFFDPAAHAGAVNSRECVGKFYCIMPGRVEAEAMAKRTVLSADQLMEAGNYFEEQGVKRTIITIKGGGLYYKEGVQAGILAPERVLSFSMTSGAGDVVSAAVVVADLEGKSIEDTGKYAMEKAAEFLAGRTDERFIDTLE